MRAFSDSLSKTLLGIVLAVALGGGCGGDSTSPEESKPVQILLNSDVEDGVGSPEHWSSAEVGPQPGNDYTFEWSVSEAHSGSHSLLIKLNAVSDHDAFAYWNQLIDTNIPHGKKLALRATVKTSLAGQGVGIMVRGDDASGPSVWATTQGAVSITGVHDWYAVSTTLGNVPAGITKLWVFLMLFPNSTGSVYFDDIELTYN
jgi:hypothetical protein